MTFNLYGSHSLFLQSTFYVSVLASSEEQKDQKYLLPATPYEKVPSLLEKAIKRFNRTQGPDKEPANSEDYILKVLYCYTFILVQDF